jgi:predicted DNA-binding protein
MRRNNSDKSNLVNMTIRVEPEYLSDLQLYSRVIGKNRSEIVRELVISALDAIPEHERRAMEIIAKCKTPS